MPSLVKTIIFTLALSLLAPYLYDRYFAFSILLGNRSSKFTSLSILPNYEILYRDVVRNCEDVLLDDALGVAILSCDPGRDHWNTVMGSFHPFSSLPNGRLWLYDYATPNLPTDARLKPLAFKDFAGQTDFHPLGLELDKPTSTLYAVNHAQSGPRIEIFKLELSVSTLTHIQTFTHPLLHAPNAIHALTPSTLLITNDHHFPARKHPLLSKLETFSGLPGGSVVYISLADPHTSKVLARLPFANGIAMLNATTLAVASTARPAVTLYELLPEHELKLRTWFRVPALVDNLSVDSAGTLLLAGHPSLDLVPLAENRYKCDPDSEVAAEREACECTAPSWVAEWTEERGLKTVYWGREFCSSTMFGRDVGRGVSVVSGLYERGIMVVRE